MKLILLVLSSLLIFSLPTKAQWSDHTISFDGQMRSYRVYTPANYDPGTGSALIVILHGLGGSMTDASTIGITNVADTANIVLISPQALDYNSPLGLLQAAWGNGIELVIPGLGTFPVNPDVDDVGFINATMDATVMSHNINPARIYMAGASMGGFMTQRMACSSSGRLAAVASVMGTYALALPACDPGKILPMAHFHGTLDEVVDYSGNLLLGTSAFPVGLPVDTLMARWAAINGCTATPTHTAWPNTNGDNFSIEHYSFKDAGDVSQVELFKANGGLHTWYQYANTGGEIDYSVEIWKFFSKHFHGSNSVDGVEKERRRVETYPNPAVDYIRFSSSTPFNEALITDVWGRAVLHLTGNTDRIGIGHLSAGYYMVRLKTKNGDSAASRFIKK